MRALVVRGVDQLELAEVPEPIIGADEVLVRVHAQGICHSDHELLRGRYIAPFRFPVIPGHEWSGEVVRVGEAVDTFQAGDRVVGEDVVGCGVCSRCKAGDFINCPKAVHLGVGRDGGDADLLRASPQWLHKFPPSFSYQQAALIEPFTVGYFTLHAIGGVDAADRVVIFGGGTIGLMCLVAARAMGAHCTLVEPIGRRREAARTLGAHSVVDPSTGELDRLTTSSGDPGADVVIEASGASGALTSSLDIARNGARLALVGFNLGQSITVEFGKIQAKGLHVRGIVGSPYVWERAISFLERTGIDLTAVVTHTFDLSEGVEAFRISARPADCIKVQMRSA